MNWSEARFKEVRDEMKNMLIKVGWQKEFVETCVPVIPLSGWKGDNLLTKSENMPWWKGVDVKQDLKAKETIHIETLFEALDKYAAVPKRRDDAPLRMPLSGCFKIKGVGDVITGRLEQGKTKDGDEVVFLPRHTDANPCVGKVFSVEMHHKKIPSASAGDNVGINIKGLSKENMPESGDIMILKVNTPHTLRNALPPVLVCVKRNLTSVPLSLCVPFLFSSPTSLCALPSSSPSRLRFWSARTLSRSATAPWHACARPSAPPSSSRSTGSCTSRSERRR